MGKVYERRKVNGKAFLLCMFCLIICSLIRVPGISIFCITIFGQALFVALVFLFERIDFSQVYIIQLTGKYSYEIFLLHHVCISLYVSCFRGHRYSLWEGIILLAGVLVLIYAAVAVEKLVEREAGKILSGFFHTVKKA